MPLMLSCLRTLLPLRDAQQEQEQRDHGSRDALPCQTTGVSPSSPTASPTGGRYRPGTLVEELFEAKAHPEEEQLLARRWSHPERCGLPTLEPALAARLAAEAERQEMAQPELKVCRADAPAVGSLIR